MKILIETATNIEPAQLLHLLQSLDIKSIRIEKEQNAPTERDTNQNPRALFGIWKDRPRTLSEIRTQTWKRDWSL